MKTVKELLSKEKRWTKGASARDEFGRGCAIEHGVSFCLMGAYRRATLGEHSSLSLVNGFYSKLVSTILALYPERFSDSTPDPRRGDKRITLHPIAAFNDHPDTTYSDIRRVLEVADA